MPFRSDPVGVLTIRKFIILVAKIRKESCTVELKIERTQIVVTVILINVFTDMKRRYSSAFIPCIPKAGIGCTDFTPVRRTVFCRTGCLFLINPEKIKIIEAVIRNFPDTNGGYVIFLKLITKPQEHCPAGITAFTVVAKAE